MIEENCKFTTEWDYKGHLGTEGCSPYDNQVDWNQTLITKINMCSANIYRDSTCGGASFIKINSKLLPLIETLMYYGKNEKTLSGRYRIEIDDTIEEDLVFVYHRLLKNEIEFYPEYLLSTYDKESFWKWTFVEARMIPEEKVNEYKKGLCSCIRIINYV